MLYEGYDVYTADHPAVVVELKVTVPIAYPLTLGRRAWHINTTKYVYFILEVLRISETVAC